MIGYFESGHCSWLFYRLSFVVDSLLQKSNVKSPHCIGLSGQAPEMEMMRTRLSLLNVLGVHLSRRGH